MFFDPRPKSTREDLYDREAELRELHGSDDPLLLVLAPRRFGKTSLVRVFLNETDKFHVFLDCRAVLSTGTSKEAFLKHFARQLGELVEKDSSLLRVLERIKGLKVFGFEVSLSDAKEFQLTELLERVNDWVRKRENKLILAFDEAQLLRFFRRAWGMDFIQLFAYVYDRLDGVQILLTGSEVGILEDFLALDDPRSPLYGRHVREIRVPRLSQAESEDFLWKGFEQCGLEVPSEVIGSAVQKLDGIIGWLVYFGKRCVEAGRVDQKALDETLQEAKELVLEELEGLFRLSEKYRYTLKAVALGVRAWSDIKEAVEMMTRTRLTDTSFNRVLTKLVKMGYLQKEESDYYSFVDPVVKEAAKEL